MRSLVIAMGLLAFTASADAKPRRASKTVAKLDKASKGKQRKSAAKVKRKDTGRAGKKKRVALARKLRDELRGPFKGQSIGACWRGRLQDAVQLREGEGWHLRRPWRAYGTDATIGHVEHVLADVADRFPDVHAIAIGDISAPQGGRISDHSSHQSGRDIDVGLIFTTRPAGYPDAFVVGTADNLDLEATFVLVEEFAKTADAADGVHMIFLDFDVQGLLYTWALENGETPEYLAKLFQYPHGRGQSVGIVRHEPHHGDHLHVRFRCASSDPACR